jgi:recombination associated protein RdgC
MQTEGWVSPRDNGMLVHTVNRQMLLQLGTEKKLLPSTVINQVSKARAAELEEQQGFKPGRKQMKELKEQVTDELLPRAFSIRRNTSIWIDPVNNWLVVDAASPAKADEVFKALLKSMDQLPIGTLRVQQSPVAAMTDWLVADEAPSGFTVDQDTELRATGEGKATVRYVRHTLEADDVRRHIAAGKQCTRLAMTWSDRVSFVLTESLTVKRVTPLDVLKENNEGFAQNDDERFDTDFALMTGELSKLMGDLVQALGGEVPAQ